MMLIRLPILPAEFDCDAVFDPCASLPLIDGVRAIMGTYG
jgi:hypothetical protein